MPVQDIDPQPTDITTLTAPDSVREAVRELLRRYAENRDQYLRPAYKETQARREFIDPLFEALGWDVTNRAGHAEAYKDVVHEDTLQVAGATKAPDYSFRIGGRRIFFLEAKRPSSSISTGDAAVESAYQLRRYGWSADLPLSILTNFEEFAVYDCTRRPPSLRPGEPPDVRLHVVARHHPERVVVDEHARGVARSPGRIRQFRPVDPVA